MVPCLCVADFDDHKHDILVGPERLGGRIVNDVKATTRVWFPDWLAAPKHLQERMIEFAVAFERASIPCHVIARAGALVDLQRSGFPPAIMTQLMRLMGDIKYNVVFAWKDRHLTQYWTTGMVNVAIDLRDDGERDPFPVDEERVWNHVIRCASNELMSYWPKE